MSCANPYRRRARPTVYHVEDIPWWSVALHTQHRPSNDWRRHQRCSVVAKESIRPDAWIRRELAHRDDRDRRDTDPVELVMNSNRQRVLRNSIHDGHIRSGRWCSNHSCVVQWAQQRDRARHLEKNTVCSRSMAIEDHCRIEVDECRRRGHNHDVRSLHRNNEDPLEADYDSRVLVWNPDCHLMFAMFRAGCHWILRQEWHSTRLFHSWHDWHEWSHEYFAGWRSWWHCEDIRRWRSSCQYGDAYRFEWHWTWPVSAEFDAIERAKFYYRRTLSSPTIPDEWDVWIKPWIELVLRRRSTKDQPTTNCPLSLQLTQRHRILSTPASTFLPEERVASKWVLTNTLQSCLSKSAVAR